MSNAYFDCKQFRINQDACAMKVSTDACIQGAWTPIPTAINTALDIGAGTGLLSLMLAQRGPQLTIQSVEINPEAVKQARDNVRQSPFSKQIEVICADILKWPAPGRYDLIICNPPFFERSLKSENAARMQARHTDTLSYTDLAGVLEDMLAADGIASILLPADQETSWLNACISKNLHLVQRLYIKPFADREPNRIVFLMSPSKRQHPDSELIIYRQPGLYTQEFTELLAPFYLHL